jgi:hypothetical protein
MSVRAVPGAFSSRVRPRSRPGWKIAAGGLVIGDPSEQLREQLSARFSAPGRSVCGLPAPVLDARGAEPIGGCTIGPRRWFDAQLPGRGEPDPRRGAPT